MHAIIYYKRKLFDHLGISSYSSVIYFCTSRPLKTIVFTQKMPTCLLYVMSPKKACRLFESVPQSTAEGDQRACFRSFLWQNIFASTIPYRCQYPRWLPLKIANGKQYSPLHFWFLL